MPVDLPLPEPAGRQVRLRVLFCGIGFTDVLMRHGQYIYAPKMPFVPGYEIVGEVEKIGPLAHGIRLGQRMAALTVTGGYAQSILLARDDLVEVPDALGSEEACSVILNHVTAYQMLHRVAQIQAGEKILISGASGGVGLALIQLGRLAGVDSYGLCSAAKADLVRGHGGIPVDSRGPEPFRTLREMVATGFDAYFDGIGGSYTWRGSRLLNQKGWLVCFGLTAAIQGGQGKKIVMLQTFAALGLVKLTRWSRATFYGITTLYRKTKQPFREDLAAVFDLLARRKLQPPVTVILGLNEARRAHELLESGQVRGKILLACQS